MVFFRQFLITLSVILITEAALDLVVLRNYCKDILIEYAKFQNNKHANIKNVEFEANLDKKNSTTRIYLHYKIKDIINKVSEDEIPQYMGYYTVGKNLATAYKNYYEKELEAAYNKDKKDSIHLNPVDRFCEHHITTVMEHLIKELYG
ncbi:uncharacterized protein LOC100302480 precursor [Acyrthosiphon pisum]|uniref:Uncharacterized protein n=1 Tax=Acyrthosiphon pisum TaxID=7029 RepID=C4WSB4_ACYPI|nr:uncharacterized protein LOC100302480 precursor [Acyrthosiphon pisum]BAH70784.1 hypothetical protein [Acyrthosiphon pisum]|eukprot:NP_001156816.1 uncharacterized protein LOC100302480 precursor [Acyrthosiphon pisum]